jgi:ubiquinone/menaquinone biosynthesis C-methylase UbiE
MRASRGAAVSAFDEMAQEYDAWFDREGKVTFDTEVRALQEVLLSLPGPWLEIGVGSGRFAQALGIKTGVDASIKLLEMAGKRGITAFLSRGEKLPFGDGAFGTVFLIATLCFVASPEMVLKEAHRILAPNGKMVLGLLLSESAWGALYKKKKRQGHPLYKYASFYTYDEVVTLLEQAGFSIGKVVATLFQKPGKVEQVELPRSGFDFAAGFTVVVASR